MEVGALVWVRDTQTKEVWLPGQITNKITNETASLVDVTTDCEEIVRIRLNQNDIEFDDIKLRNVDANGHPDDLIKLIHLNEPGILHCLQVRYNVGRIYTHTGPILIAANPFRNIDIYSSKVFEEYYNYGLLKSHGIENTPSVAPHVFAVADNAYRQMMASIISGGSLSSEKDRVGAKCNQSILISGESGAGKTESTKYVLSYLTTVGDSSSENIVLKKQGSIMDKVLQSNPILEAFGNAKTARNDNSSRFGKFIELNFNKRGVLIGGSIRTYLLEKVRLPLQQRGERNFHIFYQLLRGLSETEKGDLSLTDVSSYNYTVRGGNLKLDKIDDNALFQELKTAFCTLNFSEDDQRSIFNIVAGILHLGELKFDEIIDKEGDGCLISQSVEVHKSLEHASKLFELPISSLEDVLTIRIISAAGESYNKKLSAVQAIDTRDALAKSIYGRLFDWLVRSINQRIEVEPSSIRAYIGVLDIFGFESFALNSFEQLCINYANETLQQQFNQFVFKLEQTEYQKEKIEWSFIHFPDNHDCLELLEHKINGIFAMIDDECKLPKASDEKLAARMYKDYAQRNKFIASSAQKRDWKFSIAHYAGLVEYSVSTFVEKNKDELPREASSLLQSAGNYILRGIFMNTTIESNDVPSGSMILSKRKSSGISASNGPTSVGTQFKGQLGNLMDSIHSTSPHYVRCLKPNDFNRPHDFNRSRITEQLRYGGVLEAVRVARSGFPVRLLYHEFVDRYKLLCKFRDQFDVLKLDNNVENMRKLCSKFIEYIWTIVQSETSRTKTENIIFSANISFSKKSFQLGTTKIFLRKESHDFLESCRFRCISYASIQIQKKWRSYINRKVFNFVLQSVRLLQRVFRGHKIRVKVFESKCQLLALKIQAIFRMFVARNRFKKFIACVIILQATWRRKIIHASYKRWRYNRSISVIRRHIVGFICKRRWRCFLSAIISLQTKHRCKRSVRILKSLRAEAKDLGKLQASNDELKREIEILRNKAFEEKERLRQDYNRNAEHEVELASFKSKVSELSILLESERRAREDMERTLSFVSNFDSRKGTELFCQRCQENILKTNQNLPKRQQMTKTRLVSIKNNDRQKVLNEAIPVQEISKLSDVSISSEDSNIDIATEVLMSEVTRLKKLSLDQQAEIETLRSKANGAFAASIPQTESRAIVDNKLKVAKHFQQEGHLDTPSHQWSKMWDMEDGEEDNSEGEGQLDRHSSLNQTDKEVTLASFGDKIDRWKLEMTKGVKAHMWDESNRISQLEVVIKLDPSGFFLQFFSQRRGFGLFQSKILDIPPLRLTDICDCSPGSSIRADSFENLFLITFTALSEKGGSRIITLKYSSEEERDTFLSKYRALIAAIDLTTSLMKGSECVAKNYSLEHRNNGLHSSKDTSKISEDFLSPIAYKRSGRRTSLRESVIEKKQQNYIANTNRNQISFNTNMRLKTPENHREIKEKDDTERMKLQLAILSSEAVEKDEQLVASRRRLTELEIKLNEKENLTKQDTMVRLQLGKRLEQILIDKEEALEQLEQLKAQLEIITNGKNK